MDSIKESLTQIKMRELFGANHQFIECFNYDTLCRNDGIKALNPEMATYKNFRNILKSDARFNNNYDLVAVVSLSICPYPYSNSPFCGQVVRYPRYVKPNIKFFGETGSAGTIVCRDKKTGKILPVPKRWLYSGTHTCIVAGTQYSGLPGLAALIEADVSCNDYETYEKLIRINVLERTANIK